MPQATYKTGLIRDSSLDNDSYVKIESNMNWNAT